METEFTRLEKIVCWNFNTHPNELKKKIRQRKTAYSRFMIFGILNELYPQCRYEFAKMLNQTRVDWYHAISRHKDNLKFDPSYKEKHGTIMRMYLNGHPDPIIGEMQEVMNKMCAILKQVERSNQDLYKSAKLFNVACRFADEFGRKLVEKNKISESINLENH